MCFAICAIFEHKQMRGTDDKSRDWRAKGWEANGAVTYYRIRVTDAEWTERNAKKMFIRCSSGDESRLGDDEGLRGTCKERIKRMSSAYLTDK